MDYDEERERSEMWDKILMGILVVIILVVSGLVIALVHLS